MQHNSWGVVVPLVVGQVYLCVSVCLEDLNRWDVKDHFHVAYFPRASSLWRGTFIRACGCYERPHDDEHRFDLSIYLSIYLLNKHIFAVNLIISNLELFGNFVY